MGLSAVSGASVRLEEQPQLHDGSFAEYYTASDCQAGSVHVHAKRSAAVESAHVINGRDGDLTFHLVTSDDGVHATLEGAGALSRSNVASQGIGRLVYLVFPGVDATVVIDTILERHSGVKLVARRFRDLDALAFTAGGLERVVQDRLTDRQWEVLETAYRLGYVKRPRERNGEEVAATLGSTSATFSQHLRAAQRNLLAVLIDEAVDLSPS